MVSHNKRIVAILAAVAAMGMGSGRLRQWHCR